MPSDVWTSGQFDLGEPGHVHQVLIEIPRKVVAVDKQMYDADPAYRRRVKHTIGERYAQIAVEALEKEMER